MRELDIRLADEALRRIVIVSSRSSFAASPSDTEFLSLLGQTRPRWSCLSILSYASSLSGLAVGYLFSDLPSLKKLTIHLNANPRNPHFERPVFSENYLDGGLSKVLLLPSVTSSLEQVDLVNVRLVEEPLSNKALIGDGTLASVRELTLKPWIGESWRAWTTLVQILPGLRRLELSLECLSRFRSFEGITGSYSDGIGRLTPQLVNNSLEELILKDVRDGFFV